MNWGLAKVGGESEERSKGVSMQDTGNYGMPRHILGPNQCNRLSRIRIRQVWDTLGLLQGGCWSECGSIWAKGFCD